MSNPHDADSPSATMFDVVRQFATDLANFRRDEETARDALKREVEAQLTALRHDFYGSTLELSQRSIDMKNAIELQRSDSIEWRTAERLARELGQRGYRVLVNVALILSTAALIVSLVVAVVLVVLVL